MTLRLRTGRTAGRTLYRVNPDGTETLIGVVDTRELAQQIADAVNAARPIAAQPPAPGSRDPFTAATRAGLRAAATGGGPCRTCCRPLWTHVCLSCSPDAQTPGPGCLNCRQTGMDQTPCQPASAPCRAEYQRPGGRQHGDRIVRCHLLAGHSGEHMEANTGATWTDPSTGGQP